MFTDKRNAKIYEKKFRDGLDHDYPNTNSVRIENWFLKDKRKGNLLDYGFGFARETVYFLRKGYNVWGLDISKTAVRRGERRLKELGLKAHLGVVRANWQRLPFPDNFFDVIHSNQCVYFLADLKKINDLLDEFKRILKPNGKISVSMVGRKDSICKEGREIKKNIYRCEKHSIPQNYYVYPDKNELRKSFSIFGIEEIGSFSTVYCGVKGFHWVVLARNKK